MTEADCPPSFGGNVREDPPFTARSYRHPATGEEAMLSVRVHYPSGQPRFLVKVTRPDDRTNVPGVMYSTDPGTRARAREVWAQREHELLAAGYERVPDQQTPSATAIRDGAT